MDDRKSCVQEVGMFFVIQLRVLLLFAMFAPQPPKAMQTPPQNNWLLFKEEKKDGTQNVNKLGIQFVAVEKKMKTTG